ncbi:hypothetical protein C8A03DRAFT_13482, partial [Achaetomium macrosporum]
PVLVWEDLDVRGATLHDYRRILDDFAPSSAHLLKRVPLTYQAFRMPQGERGTWLDSWPLKYLELICFDVPPGLLERQLFEHAYAAFADMTRPSEQAGIPTACKVSHVGGRQPAEATESSDSQLFMGVLPWEDPAARREWYEELFRLSCWSYELFGHKLDALKILAARGVTARFLELQREYLTTNH